jgi:multimeric flavodoxin WrbA
MRALVLNATLKRSPEPSNAAALAQVLIDVFESDGIETELVRLVDHDVHPGVTSDEGDGDAWPEIRARIIAADILVVATPIWLGQPSSVAKRALERMDAMLSETDEDGRPIAFGKVAGIVVVGNEDGAHHVVAEVAQALIDIGFTVPGQAWTYWHRGPGPGPDYLDDDAGHDWSDATGRTAARNLVSCARALEISPYPVPQTA